MTTIVYRKGRLMADTQVTYQGRFDDIFTNAFEKLGLKQKREDLKTSTMHKIVEVNYPSTFRGERILAIGGAGDIALFECVEPITRCSTVGIEEFLNAFVVECNKGERRLHSSTTIVVAVSSGCYFFNIHKKEKEYTVDVYFHSRKDSRFAGTGSGWSQLMVSLGFIGEADVDVDEDGVRRVSRDPQVACNGDNWLIGFLKTQMLKFCLKKNIQMKVDIYSNEITDVISC